MSTIKTDISTKNILFYFLIGFVLVAISDVPGDWRVLYYVARGFLCFLLFSTFVIPVRPAVLLLLVIAIAGQDIVSSGDLIESNIEYFTASLWQLHIGPINASAIFFVCLLWQLWRINGITTPPVVRRALIWFSTVPVITGFFYGGFFSEHAGIEAIVDIKLALMLMASTILFLTLFKDDTNYLIKVLTIFTGALLARHLMDLIYVIANVGPAITTGVTRGSEDSAKGCIAFLIYLGLVIIWMRKRLLYGMAIVVPSVLLMVAYNTRNLWITFLFGTVILILCIGLRRSLPLLAIGIIVSFIGVGTLFIVNPGAAKLSLLRSQTITEGRPEENYAVLVDYNLISRIDQVRYAQIFNVLESVSRRYAYLWGTGYGGFYEDKEMPFPRDLTYSFPDYSFETGKFYRTHQFTTHIYLKHGLLGLFFIISLWFIPGYMLFKIFRRENMFTINKPTLFHGMMLSLVAFLPTGMFQTYWSGKGLFINGMLISTCLSFNKLYPLISTNKTIFQRMVNLLNKLASSEQRICKTD